MAAGAEHHASFRIDFMLPDERRSGSQVSRKFTIRMIAIILPAAAALSVAILMWTARSRQNQLKLLQQDYDEWNGKAVAVNELKAEKNRIHPAGDFLEGWRKTRMEWSGILSSFQLLIPDNIQLLQFVANESVTQDRQARAIRIMISGMVRGDNAEEYVIKLKDSLMLIPRFKELNVAVKVKRYGKYESGGELGRDGAADIKVFEIECNVPPRPIIGGRTTP